MKIFSFLLPAVLVTSVNSLQAQHVDMSADSVTKILCRQWKLSYVLMPDGQQIAPFPGMSFDFGFNADHTFTSTHNHLTEKEDPSEKHTWSLDEKKKKIVLRVNGESNSEIIALKADELTVIIHVKDSKTAPQDIEGTKMVLIPQN